MITDFARDDSSSALLNTNKDKLKEYRKSKALVNRITKLEYLVQDLTKRLVELEAKR